MATDNLSIREKITSMIAEYTEYHGGDLGTPMDYSIHSILKVAEILVSKQKVQEKRLYDILTEYDAEKEKSANDIQHWRTKAAGHENKIALLEQSNRVQEEKMNELTKEKNEEIAKAWQQIESLEGKLKAKETELENVQGRWEHRENIIREERKTHRSFQKGADKAKEKMDQIWETYRSKFRYAWEMNMEQLELAGQVDPSHGIAAGPHKQAQMSPSSKRDVRKRKESNESKSPCPEESEDRKQRSPETMSKLPKMLKSSAEGVIADFCIASTAGMDASPDIKVPPQEHPQQEDVQMVRFLIPLHEFLA